MQGFHIGGLNKFKALHPRISFNSIRFRNEKPPFPSPFCRQIETERKINSRNNA